MNDLLRLRDNGPQWPYSRAQLTADEPQLSLSFELPEHELRSLEQLNIYVYRVVTAEPPAADPRTERVEEVTPALVGDEWVQQWTVRAATEEEIAAYDAANAPLPRWVQFGAALAADAPVNEWFGALFPQAPVLHGMISVGLGQAAQGDPKTFLAAWSQALAAGLVSLELAESVAAMAASFDLPADFISALTAPPPAP